MSFKSGKSSNELLKIAQKAGYNILVAFDKTKTIPFKIYFMKGEYTNFVNKAVRRQYHEDTGCDYFDTRVIKFSTYERRKFMGLSGFFVPNDIKIFDSKDYVKTHTIAKREKINAEYEEFKRKYIQPLDF